MDMTFASLFVTALELVENGSLYGPTVHSLPESLDWAVAKRKSDALGMNVDEATDE
jgi:S-adenosylhomocysteine hydrolase